MPDTLSNPSETHSAPLIRLRDNDFDRSRRKLFCLIFFILALLPIAPMVLLQRSLREFRNWNPSWDTEGYLIIGGICSGLLLSSWSIGWLFADRITMKGFWRSLWWVLTAALAWAVPTILGIICSFALYGIRSGDFSQFRAEIAPSEILLGIPTVALFITLPLSLLGLFIIRLIKSWNRRAT